MKLIPPTWLFRAMLAGAFLFSPGCSTALAAANTNEVTLLAPQWNSNRSFRFYFQALEGQNYPVEVSVDMLHWFPLTTAVGANVPYWIQDDNATNFQKRFYHVGGPLLVPNMVFIAPGSFVMGSPNSETSRATNEGPQTTVTLTQGFWMGKYEVTQAELYALTGTIDSAFQDQRLPVDFITWIDATNYCQKLTERERGAGHLPDGFVYRLPTEAEWEYACRAGTSAPFGVGSGTSLASTQANFDGGFPYGGAPKGQFINYTTVGGTYPPNAWGLYDMEGNVWEWCQDIYGPYSGGSVTDPKGAATGSTYSLRGGNFNSVGAACRSSKRDNRAPTYSNFGVGFRIVLARP